MVFVIFVALDYSNPGPLKLPEVPDWDDLDLPDLDDFNLHDP